MNLICLRPDRRPVVGARLVMGGIRNIYKLKATSCGLFCIRKPCPRIHVRNGMQFPLVAPLGNCIPFQRQILGRTFRNPIHPESPSHSEYIQRTHESVSSRTASSSWWWKMSPQTLATVAPMSVKKKASRISRLSHLYCFARRTANDEATRPKRPFWRLQPCCPDLPWWDGPSRQPSCRAASYSERCRDLARAWPRSAA